MTFRLPTAIIQVLVCVVAVISLTVALAPGSVAAPDYSGYQPVDPKPFQTYHTYGGAGVQFTSPSGLLCRLVIITRGQFAYASCLGELHGGAEGSNQVWIDTGGAGTYSKSTRDAFLTAQTVDETGVHNESISDTGFPLLPAGSSITYTASVWSGTCAVDADTTRCTVSPTTIEDNPTKSFKLGPTDSTFS